MVCYQKGLCRVFISRFKSSQTYSRQAWLQGIEVQRLLRGLGKWHSPPFLEYPALSELYPEIYQWTTASRQKAQAVLDQSYIIEKEFEIEDQREERLWIANQHRTK